MIDEMAKADFEKLEFHPAKNDKAISIIQMEDGNWRGFYKKHGKLVQVRQADPGTVLQLLLTAE